MSGVSPLKLLPQRPNLHLHLPFLAVVADKHRLLRPVSKHFTNPDVGLQVQHGPLNFTIMLYNNNSIGLKSLFYEGNEVSR